MRTKAVGFSLTTKGLEGQFQSFSRVRAGGARVAGTARISRTREAGGQGAGEARNINRIDRTNRTRSTVGAGGAKIARMTIITERAGGAGECV